MPSSRQAPSPRRKMFLKLSGQIEGQLRDAYAKKSEAGVLNQSSLADKLGVDRSAVHRRLTGRVNMTEETVADMVWGLEHDIEVRIFDPSETKTNNKTPTEETPAPGNAERDPTRCEICDWPLADSQEKGCIPGDCSYRPDDPAEQARIRARRETSHHHAQTAEIKGDNV